MHSSIAGPSAVIVTAIFASYLVVAGLVYVGLGIFSSAKGGWARVGHIVLGLLLYALSARDAATPPSMFDRLQLVMVVAALVVDGFVLVAMIGRIGEFGASANKVASLGLNLILLVNLAVAAWLQWRFVRGQVPLARLERWQTGYLPAYTVWAVIVIGVLPPVFGYV